MWTKEASANTLSYDAAGSGAFLGAGTVCRSLHNNGTYEAETGTLSTNFQAPQLLTTSAVPEPGRALLLSTGAALLLMCRRRG